MTKNENRNDPWWSPSVCLSVQDPPKGGSYKDKEKALSRGISEESNKQGCTSPQEKKVNDKNIISVCFSVTETRSKGEGVL